MKLNDPTLLKERCYVGGEWVGELDPGGQRSRHRRGPRQACRVSARRRPRDAIEKAEAAFPGWARKTAKERAGPPAPLVRPDHRQPRRHRADHDQRAGQAARRGARRGRLRRRASSSSSPRRRSASTARPSRRHRADARIVVIQPADRRRRRDHAVEFPGRDDHPQGARPALAAGCTVVRQAGRRDAADRARARRARRARRHPAGRAQRRHRQVAARSARVTAIPLVRMHRLHRLDRGRQAADARSAPRP